MKLSELQKSNEKSDFTFSEIARQQEEYLKNHETQFDSSIYQQAMKSYGDFQKDIDRFSKSGLLGSVLQEKPSYCDAIEKLSKQFVDDKGVLNSLQDLNSLASSIQNDVHKIKVDELMKKELERSSITTQPMFIPENPIQEVIRQNKQLNDSMSTNNSLLSAISELLMEQKKLLDDQKVLTRLQLDQKDKDIKDNRKWVYITLFITFISLCVSGYYGWKSVDTSENIYIKENISDDKQHQDMMELLKKSQAIDTETLNNLTHDSNNRIIHEKK